eukprot:GHRR01028390.1.p1 GENE.GHRR01028390.1~~GHRR01028390.1.p1  ORF type:complete len:156 (+),score=28.36 GHRR01028390.1:785-1252(+)
MLDKTPAGRNRSNPSCNAATLPTNSSATSAPLPAVAAATAAAAFDMSTAAAPNCSAFARLSGTTSTAIIFEAPLCFAARIASIPTGPQPSISTVSPGCMLPWSAQKNAVDKMSPSKIASSLLMPSGTCHNNYTAANKHRHSCNHLCCASTVQQHA